MCDDAYCTEEERPLSRAQGGVHKEGFSPPNAPADSSATAERKIKVEYKAGAVNSASASIKEDKK